MKTIINYIGGGPVRFDKFADANALMLVINEVDTKPEPKYVCAFDCSVVSYMGTLVNCFGEGPTPNEAVRDYRRKLKGHVLVADPASVFRREIQCPLQWREDMN